MAKNDTINTIENSAKLIIPSDPKGGNPLDSNKELATALEALSDDDIQDVASFLVKNKNENLQQKRKKREKWEKLRKNGALYGQDQWLHRGEGDDKKIILKKGDRLNLQDFGHNFHIIPGIGNSTATYVSKMKLEECVQLFLQRNDIGDEGAIALSKMKLEEGVEIYLQSNNIGDIGAAAFIENLELKEGVILNLAYNNISEGMKQKLKKWNQSYIDKGVNCEVVV